MGKIVAITGVSTGLGLALTKWFSSQGHTVVGCGRSAAKIAEMNEKYCGKGKPNQFYVVDITDDSVVKEWATNVCKSFGPPDFVLNNAGFVNQNAPLWEITAEEFDKVVDVNLKGSANVIRSFLPKMIKAGKGVIVNFSSGYGKAGKAKMAPYCATKWGIEGLTRALAMELPPSMACIALDPGMVNTPMLQGHLGGTAAFQQTPEQWAERAGPLVLSITAKSNGKSICV
ncbi:predicted protein [Nematostella vectensis]|uniref:Uncharacterized protein n=1 Tax=Nematostella vectensis TaxID=45351 RepID=A7RMI4_NEMVE|nr:predicted protein [Nematostella vectensis]|eukprot:XP_001639337.1 predicted protein [Nematostella vectensis]